MKLAVVGTGYVGLVSGVCFASGGHEVTCVDNDEQKIQALNSGKIPIHENGLEDLLAASRSKITFTTGIKEVVEANEVVFIAVGTPDREDGSADLRAVRAVCSSIAQFANGPKCVVLKSTVPVGTAVEIQAYFDAEAKHSIEVINNPEFLREGSAIQDFLKPDRVVIGVKSERAQAVMRKIYEPFQAPVIVMGNASAEMTKYAANSFLAVKISFINELARLSDEVGADIEDVKRGFTSDARINPAFFYPGVGYGGSCFPKDVKAIVKTGTDNGIDMSVIQAAERANEKQKTHLPHLMKEHFGSLKGLRVAIWGLSFKPNTDDVREAPAQYIIRELNASGAKAVAYDPVAGENAKKFFDAEFELASSSMEALQGADCLLVVTEWLEFRNADLRLIKAKLKKPVIFDGRNLFDPKSVKAAGFDYYCVGRQVLADGGLARKKTVSQPVESDRMVEA